MGFLKEGDVIELRAGHKVNAIVPKHFLYSNRKGDFTLDRGNVTIGGELSFLEGRYIVVKTSMDGGGTGHGPHDVYPDGHHVYCQKSDAPEQTVDFWQSGCFTAMITDIEPVGRAVMAWQEIDIQTSKAGAQ